MDLIFPPSARISGSRTDLVSNTASSRSIFTGAVRTTARAGDRWRVGLSIENTSDRETYTLRSQLKALRAGMRGQANRVMLTDPAYVQRGSFPSSELFSNNLFNNSTTGWSHYADYDTSVVDRVYRAVSVGTGNNGAGGPGLASYAAYQTPSLVQYAPYVTRAVLRQFGSPPLSYVYDVGIGGGLGILAESPFPAGGGYVANAGVSTTSSSTGVYAPTGPAGSGLDIYWMSLSRCGLLDTGTNMLLRSDEFDHATYTKSNVTVSANTGLTLAPDGTSTADNIIETTANDVHRLVQQVTVSSAVADYSYSVALKTNGRSYCRLILSEATGVTSISAYFNLSTGATGATATGTNWANLRTFSSDLGNGWWQFSIVGKKANAATTLNGFVSLATGDTVESYTGSTSFGMFAWRATLAQSSVPTRLVQTVNAASTGTSPTGSSVYLKGLPASTSGLAVSGDLVEIYGSGLHRFVSPLDSNASGLGVAQFEPNLHNSSLADNTPIIFCNPLGRFVLSENEGGWDDSPGQLSSFDFQFEESLDS